MAEYYEAHFTIDSQSDAPNMLGIDLMKQVEGVVWKWANEHLEEPVEVVGTRDWKDAGGATLHVDKGQLDVSGFCRIVLEHPDTAVDTLTWRSDFRLATEGSGVDVEVEVRRMGEGDEAIGTRGSASRPRALVTLFQEYECSFDGNKLTTESERIHQKASSSFVRDVLTNPNRRMPVVVVTENSYGGLFIGADNLQSRLLGLASVFTYDNDTARTVNYDLSDWLRCWDGAIRVYRPGCSPDDASRQNVFWTWRRMNYIASARGWDELFQEIADECLIHSLPQASPRLYDSVSGQVRQDRYERLLERFETAALDESVYQELLTEGN